MSEIFWAFETEYEEEIEIKHKLRSLKKKEDKPIPIKLGKNFKSIKIKKISGKWPDKDMYIKIPQEHYQNCTIVLPDGFNPQPLPNICSITFSPPSAYKYDFFEIKISYSNGNKGKGDGYTDPNTTVTIGDPPPSANPKNKR